MRIGERSIIGAESSRITGSDHKTNIHEVGMDRIPSQKDTEEKQNPDASEANFFAKTMAKMAKEGKDVSGLLDMIQDTKMLNKISFELNKMLDPSMSNEEWDALVPLVTATIERSKTLLKIKEVAPLEAHSTLNQEVSSTEPGMNVDVADFTAAVDDESIIGEGSVEDNDNTLADESVEEAREQNEPTLEEKVNHMNVLLKEKDQIAKDITGFARHNKEFMFNQGDGDWIEACSELLGDTNVIDEQIAKDMREVAADMRNIKKLYGEQRNDAIKRVQRVERAVKQKLTQAKAERGSKLDVDMTLQFMTERDAFADFEALVQGKDPGSRNSHTEGYWKNLKKFMAKDSRLSGAEAVVNEILQKKIYSDRDEKGVNKVLGRKTVELQAAIRNGQISEKAS